MRQNNLAEPLFQNLSGGFDVTLIGPGKSFEEEIEKEKLHKLDINERQRKAIEYLRREKKIIRRVGKGKDTYYTFVTE